MKKEVNEKSPEDEYIDSNGRINKSNRKTVYEIVDNKTGEQISTFSFPVRVRMKETEREIVDIITDTLIETFSFSVRVRLRKTDVDEYKKTHDLIEKTEVDEWRIKDE